MNIKMSLMLRNAAGRGTENDKRREVGLGPVNMLLFPLSQRARKIDCKVIFTKMVRVNLDWCNGSLDISSVCRRGRLEQSLLHKIQSRVLS